MTEFAASSSAMGYTVELGELRVYCDTAADVVRLWEVLERRGIASKASEVVGVVEERAEESTLRLVRFLELIRGSAPKGISTDRLAERLGLGGSRGIGAITAALNRRTEDRGYTREDIATLERGEGGERIWKPGPKLEDALAHLKKSISAVAEE